MDDPLFIVGLISTSEILRKPFVCFWFEFASR